MNKVRRIAEAPAVGHLGTLDPLATGVLPLLIGSATRLAKFYGNAEKVYEARLRFGFTTDTYDADGKPAAPEVAVDLNRDQVQRALTGFRGVIQQLPPAFSAKKIGGVRAYKLARQNKAVNLAPVEVEIFALDLLDLSGNEATIRVHCATGTYVRSLAHDLGTVLGCGAHLAGLRRIRSGDFRIGQARTIAVLEILKAEGRLAEAIIPAADLLPDFPSVVVGAATAAQIRDGRTFHSRSPARTIKAVTEAGALLAIAEAVLPDLYHPVVVLPAAPLAI